LRFVSTDVICTSCPAPGRYRRVTKEDNVLSQTTRAVGGTTATQTALNGQSKSYSSEQLLERIISSLNDDKAEDVVTISLRGKSEMADFMVVCTGTSSRLVTSISEKLVRVLKKEFNIICKVEGKDQGDWVLVDAGDAIVHVFRPEVREFYQLEKMWMNPGQSSEDA